MLPSVDFCGLRTTRLIIGANPFGGFSHQNSRRDAEMIAYYTDDRIIETWTRAEAAGINTFVTNNETSHVVRAVRKYLKDSGSMQWIAQVNSHDPADMPAAVDKTVEIGCSALYFHGGAVDQLYENNDAETLQAWCRHARSAGVPVGTAAHAPAVHDWIDRMDIVDFHAVCFFNCGSLHTGNGHKFRLGDAFEAAECIRRLQKPCIAYKIMGAGRIDPLMAFEYAFKKIKPEDIVNVGMYRGDKDEMVEENAKIARSLLECDRHN